MAELSNNTRIVIAMPVLFFGGTEIHTHNLVKALTSQDYSVFICCYYDYDSSMVSKLKEAGAEVILMGLNRSDGLLNLFLRLRGLLKKLKPDIVHIQYIAPGLIPIITARVSGVKRIFATVHQPGHPYGLKAKLLIRIAAFLCNLFFCCSKSVEESWFGHGELYDPEKTNFRQKHFTVYNGVDMGKIRQIADEAYQQKLRQSLKMEDVKVVGVVGRLRREKGQEVLLSAMPEVVRRIPNVMLLVIGDGPDRKALEWQVKNLNIAEHVLWLGKKDQEEVFQLYSIMDVVAIPSLFEGFGFIAAEAMAAGRPAVGTRVDGLSEVIDDGVTGYLVQVGDSRGLADALIDLLLNEEKRKTMGERGRERAEGLFAMEHFTRSVISAYAHFS